MQDAVEEMNEEEEAEEEVVDEMNDESQQVAMDGAGGQEIQQEIVDGMMI